MFNKHINGFLNSTLIYLFANILNSAVPFLLLPIFTRYLSTTEYGIISTFQVIVGLMTPVLSMNVAGAICLKFYNQKSVNFSVYVSSCLFYILASTVIITSSVLIFSDVFSYLFALPTSWLWSLTVIACGQSIISLNLFLWQACKLPMKYGLFQVGQTIVNLGLALVLVVSMEMGWQGRIIAQVSATVLFGVLSIWSLSQQKLIIRKIRIDYIKNALYFGFPLMIRDIFGWLFASADRLIINSLIGLSATGVYSVAYQISMVITLIETSFNNAWVPWFYEQLKKNDPKVNGLIVKYTYIYVILIFLVTLVCVTIVPSVLGIIVGKDFTGAREYIGYLLFAKALYAMQYMTCNYLFYTEKTYYTTLAVVISGVTHVLSAYFLITHNGVIGAAQATLISSTMLTMLIWIFANKAYKMPWLLGAEK